MSEPKSGGAERTLLVHLDAFGTAGREDPAEFRELAISAGADIVGFVELGRIQPAARYLVGTGKVEELAVLVEQNEAELVIFNLSLTPRQERNLERALGCRVIDRVGLILDIFAQRAQTHEGKLQVELAQLEHISTRLVRSRTDLSRQQGGIGLRGPGETQLETDRRLLRIRMRQIRARLEKVKNQRELARRSRQRAEIPAVSLVGYTNAGKSTLFNSITAADVYAADKLFATLDPRIRKIRLPDIGTTTLADTVGFIRHLPHKLVDAFRATLEESANADLLLHVIDAGAAERDEQVAQVYQVLEEIGAGQVPVLEVYNKIDLLDGMEPHIQRDEQGRAVRVWLSAQGGQGTGLLLQAMSELLAEEMLVARLCLPHSLSRLRSRLFELEAVRAESHTERGEYCLDVRVSLIELKRLLSDEGLEYQSFLHEYAG